MPYTYRTVKGSPLTHAEYDENWSYTEELFEDTEAAKEVAVSAGNFQGRWSDQAGAVSPPYAVSHNGRTWALTVALPDVTASEPSEANTDWQLLLGTSATKDVGTDPGQIPLNSDLPTFGTVVTKDHGAAAGEVPLNSDLGTASLKNIGVAAGDVIALENDDEGNPGIPAISIRRATGLSHPIYVLFNASPETTYPPLYACRSWLNFNGLDSSIRDHGNISSIVDEGSAEFTVNFVTAMPDANYAVVASTGGNEIGNPGTGAFVVYNYAAGSFRIATGGGDGTRFKRERVALAVFR